MWPRVLDRHFGLHRDVDQPPVLWHHERLFTGVSIVSGLCRQGVGRRRSDRASGLSDINGILPIARSRISTSGQVNVRPVVAVPSAQLHGTSTMPGRAARPPASTGVPLAPVTGSITPGASPRSTRTSTA